MTAVDDTSTPASTERPPGPRLPKGMQSMMFMAASTKLLPKWQSRYGDVFSLNIAPSGRSVVLSNPEHIREVFNGPADTFHAGEGNAILAPIMGEHSVLLLDEDAHREGRKRVMAAFRGETTRSWTPVIEQVVCEAVASWPDGTEFAVHPRLNDISLEVILRIVFGVTDDERLQAIRPKLQTLVQVGPKIILGWVYPALQKVGPWRRFAQVKAATDALIYDEITARRAATDLADRTDVLSKLLVADPDQSDAELRDHLITLLLAGYETSASSLAWTLHDLARNPEVLARAQQAADTDDDNYLEAVVKESMRVRPVITNVARRLAKPVTVAGYELPAGLVVFPSIRLVQQRPDVYDSPAEFRPERFLGKNPPATTYIPFGGGLRRCLGAALATVEAVAVLKTVLRTVEISPVGEPEGDRGRNITILPAKGARIIARRR